MALIVLYVLFGIVSQYRWYFPANFQVPGFLMGRESFFVGSYRIAFYLHIICGPIVVILGLLLFGTGQKSIGLSLHRLLGKVQFILVVFILGPSGFVLATRAHTGTVAGVGFALLSIASLIAAFEAVRHARNGDVVKHQRWATRLLILLLSPVVLRLLSIAGPLLQFEPKWFYQVSAWASWLLPILIFELWQSAKSIPQFSWIPNLFVLKNFDGE